MSTKPGSMPVSALPMHTPVLSTFRLASRPSPRACRSCLSGLTSITARKSAWNLPADSGFLSSTSSKNCLVTLAHPKYTKPQKGNKTDRKDAKWICDLFMCDMIKPSFIPPPDQYRHQRGADAALPFPDRLYFAGRRGQQSAQSAASGGLDVTAFGVFHRLNPPQAETISIVPRRRRLNPHAVVALHKRLLP